MKVIVMIQEIQIMLG